MVLALKKWRITLRNRVSQPQVKNTSISTLLKNNCETDFQGLNNDNKVLNVFFLAFYNK